MRPKSISSCDVAGGRQKGAAAVEFALVIVILLLILAGIIEFGRAFWYYDALTKATRDGARFMTTVAKGNIGTAAAAPANIPPYTSGNPLTVRSIVVNAANAANVSPVLTPGNVSVSCQDAVFQTVSCQDGTAPVNVKVAITGYSVTIGEWIGFVLPSGGGATFTPHTTMRYMCTSSTGTTCYF